MIEPVTADNLDEVLPLIAEYQTFYGVEYIDHEKNRAFFSQFGEHNPSGCQFLYRKDGAVLGFATVYFSYTSTIAVKVAVMSDLYTLPAARGQGVGRALMEHCHAYAKDTDKDTDKARLQRLTTPNNTQAQKLYDRLDAKKSDWVFYIYGLKAS